MIGIEYALASFVCLILSNWQTWRLAERHGIGLTLENLKKDGVFDYLEE